MQTSPQRDEGDSPEVAVAKAIEACDGDLRATIRALILANQFLETQISQGYRRGVIHGRFNCYSG
ncbi:MAG: hypothetical protein K5821_14280 [Nitrobacter sp.]|uniref:hypothetical protein n=1 Tax=Nitrobacter sp. TaxID=29420 RepID=UPI00262581BE|nr:hypothetical protein [Nitrobacter sp.]MCV0387565.1 hypothetical protein [Nitrobacter sp.]